MLLQVSGLAVELKKRSRLRASPAAALRDQLQGLRAVETEWFNACEPLADSRCIGVGPAFCIHSSARADVGDPNEDMHKRLKLRKFAGRFCTLHGRTQVGYPARNFAALHKEEGTRIFALLFCALAKPATGLAIRGQQQCLQTARCPICVNALLSCTLPTRTFTAWRMAPGPQNLRLRSLLKALGRGAAAPVQTSGTMTTLFGRTIDWPR
jgi:hypothetical protein